jgi:tetratricopeptide (TPR) repeat protein
MNVKNISKRIYSNRSVYFILLLLSGLILVYAQTSRYGFFNIDDDHNIYADEKVASGLSTENVMWSLTSFHINRYVPVTTISQQVDCQLYGLWAGGHHITNVILYALSVIILFLALQKITNEFSVSCITVMLYAFHPLQVETVVWITQRNDVLAGLFLFLSLYFYGVFSRKSIYIAYLLSVVSYVLALGSKGTVLAFPFILLFLDYWPLQKLSRINAGKCISEKIPFFVFSFLAGISALYANRIPIEPFPPLSFIQRLENAIMAYFTYLYEILIPYSDGSYSFQGEKWNFLFVAILGAIFVLTLLASFIMRKKYPYIMVGWLWYIFMLFPMTGMVSVIGQAFGDRYVYIAKIGIFLVIAYGVSSFARKTKIMKITAYTIIILFSFAFAFLAYRQTSYWSDNIKLWRHCVEINDDNEIAHLNLGILLLQQGDEREAIIHYNKAVNINPKYADAHLLLGIFLMGKGDVQSAFECFSNVAKLRPYCVNARLLLGYIYLKSGFQGQALEQFAELERYFPLDQNIRVQVDGIIKACGGLH